MIKVQAIDNDMFQVVVEGVTKTTHRVTVSNDYHQKLTAGRMTKEELVKRSFDFLLERESNTSILRTFDLPVISHYFPEYERVIGSVSDK